MNYGIIRVYNDLIINLISIDEINIYCNVWIGNAILIMIIIFTI
jgi:hypothetical protein